MHRCSLLRLQSAATRQQRLAVLTNLSIRCSARPSSARARTVDGSSFRSRYGGCCRSVDLHCAVVKAQKAHQFIRRNKQFVSGKHSKQRSWNSLTAHIRSVDTLPTFKRHLKLYLFQSAFQSSCASTSDSFSRFLAILVCVCVHGDCVLL